MCHFAWLLSCDLIVLMAAMHHSPPFLNPPFMDSCSSPRHFIFYQPEPFGMPVPMYPIRNTLNSFTSPSTTATTTGASSSSLRTNILLNLGGLVAKHNAYRARRGSSLSSQGHSANISKRVPKTSIRLPYSHRRVPPPSMEEDEDSASYFAPPPDEQAFNPTRTVIYDTHPSPPVRTRRSSLSSKDPIPRKSSPIHSETLFIPTQIALAPDSESRSKIVAGILLHRVHAVGKPMRRKIVVGHEGPRTYVRSSLSTMVTVDC